MNPKIKDVKVILTAPEGINLAVVKVTTTEPGLYGLGCATFAYRCLTVKHLIEEYLRPLIVGRDVTRISELWQLMNQNAYWRYGPVVNNAVSGIDMALWDIKGKMANMPLYDLLGGKVREGVMVYRHADGRDAEEVCDNIEKYRSIGVRCIRCQCGGYGGTYGAAPAWAAGNAPFGVYLDNKGYMRETLKLFDAVRAKVGFDVDIVHDVHERIHPSDSVRFVREMEQYKPFFLEDVVPLEQTDWLGRIRQNSVTPIAEGELFNNPAEYRGLISGRMIDFLRVHISQIGGITPARRLQTFCEQYGVRICWHGPGDLSPVGHTVNIHMDLSSPNCCIQEWSGIEPPNSVIQQLKGPRGALLEVFRGMPTYGNDGFVYANDRPGLGIEFDEEEAAKYPCENGVTVWTQTRLADGSLQTP